MRYVSIDNTRKLKSANAATGDLKRLPTSPNIALAGPLTTAPSIRKYNELNQFMQEQAESTLMGAQKCQNLSDLSSFEKIEVKVPNREHKVDSDWKLVNHKKTNPKRRKTLTLGSYSGSSTIVGLDSYKALHASNLKPDTTAEELQTFLKQNFCDVKS